ncbi:MAG: ABC transporter permease [Candidatus Omnitrophica bacterium]|nr:ABC transporter permease [Candidatus Omnitrophota bacterium]
MNFNRMKSRVAVISGDLKKKIKGIFVYRHTIWQIALAQTKAKYTGNCLGIWVAVLNPLLIMFAISFVFTKIIYLEINNFPLFVLAGIFPWMFFASAIAEAASSIVSQQAMMRQFNFPKEHLPLASVTANFLTFLIGWAIICPIFMFFNPASIKLLPLLAAGLLLSLIFVSGMAMIVGVLNVFFRDIGLLLGTILMFWFWMTPVFYSIDMVPDKVRWICAINPMTWFIIFYRDILFHGVLPEAAVICGLLCISVLSVLIGLGVVIAFEKELLKKI